MPFSAADSNARTNKCSVTGGPAMLPTRGVCAITLFGPSGGQTGDDGHQEQQPKCRGLGVAAGPKANGGEAPRCFVRFSTSSGGRAARGRRGNGTSLTSTTGATASQQMLLFSAAVDQR